MKSLKRSDSRTSLADRCKYDLQDILGHIHGELNPDVERDFLRHLDDCPACRGTVAELVAMTPETTRMFFRDIEREPVETGHPDAESIKLEFPFPDQLDRLIQEHSKKQQKTHGKLLISTGLIVWLDELTKRTRHEIAAILASVIPQTPPAAAFSAVRSGQTLVQMDIVNLTETPLDDARLQPSIQNDKWSLSGFEPEFRDCRAYLLVLPIAGLKDLIPGWTRTNSQDLLTSWLSSEADIRALPDVLAIPGNFISEQDGVALEFIVSPEQSRLIHSADRIATAVLILN